MLRRLLPRPSTLCQNPCQRNLILQNFQKYSLVQYRLQIRLFYVVAARL